MSFVLNQLLLNLEKEKGWPRSFPTFLNLRQLYQPEAEFRCLARFGLILKPLLVILE